MMISMSISSKLSNGNHFGYNTNTTNNKNIKYNNPASLIYLIVQVTISFILVIQLLNKPLGIKSSQSYNSNNYGDDEDAIDLNKNSKFSKINNNYFNNHKNYDYSNTNYDYQNNNFNIKTMKEGRNTAVSSAANDFLFHSYDSLTTSSHHSKHLSRYNSTRLKIRKNSFIPSHRSMIYF